MGNLAGWLISGVLVVLVMGLLVVPIACPSTTPPAAELMKRGYLDTKQIKMPISVVTGSMPSASGDAGADYAQAVSIYRNNRAELAPINQLVPLDDLPNPMPASAIEIAEHIQAGAAKNKMTYTFVHTPHELSVSFDYPPAKELFYVANVALNVAEDNLRTDSEAAIKIAQAVCTMGWHMFNERAIADMEMQGLWIQASAADALGHFYQKSFQTDRAQAVRDYSDAVFRVHRDCTEKRSRLCATQVNPGNVFFIAENDADRAWRVRAVLSLGLVKFAAREMGDKRYNKRLILRYMEDSDPLIKAAAVAARHLMFSEYNVLGVAPIEFD